MSGGSRQNEKFLQYYSNITDCLRSKDDSSIEVALKLITGLMSRGYNLSELAPLIVNHVVNKRDEIEILAQMLIIQLTRDNKDNALIAIQALQNAAKSTNEAKRLRAIKTITNIEIPEIAPVLMQLISEMKNETSPYVRKAIILGLAKVVKLDESNRRYVKEQLNNVLQTSNPIEISGAIFACEMINETQLVSQNSDNLWQILLELDPWAQSRALHHLRSAPDPKESVVSVLLHSQNAAVVIEAASYFESNPSLVIQPLIRLLYAPPVVAVHALVMLERISKSSPESIAPFCPHFLPPQPSEHSEFLSVSILGNVGRGLDKESTLRQNAIDCLLRWALNSGSAFAAHALGEMGAVDALRVLLTRGRRSVAEIAAHYAALAVKAGNDALLAALLEAVPSAPVVAVFSDSCAAAKELALAMIAALDGAFDSLARDVKCEAALLAARMAAEPEGRALLDRCLGDSCADVARRARILDIIVRSDREEMRKTVWASRPPEKPAAPVIAIPQL